MLIGPYRGGGSIVTTKETVRDFHLVLERMISWLTVKKEIISKYFNK